jgi:hypothetical protein
MNCWKAGGAAREVATRVAENPARRKALSSGGGGMSDGGARTMPEVAVGSKGNWK